MRYLDVPYFQQDTLYTCGPTALQMALGYYGMRESELALRTELDTDPERGTDHEHMIDAVVARGLHCYVNDNSTLIELAYLMDLAVPVVVRFLETAKDEDHYGVVVGVTEEDVVLHDPWHGAHTHFSHKEFESRWVCNKLGSCHHWLMAVSRAPLQIGRQYHPE